MTRPIPARLPAIVATCLLILGILIGSAGPAAARTTATFTTDLVTPTLSAAAGGPWVTVLRLPPLTLAANQSVYLYGQIAARSNAPRGPMIGGRIVCLAAGGGGGSTYSTRNHDGKSYGVQSVVNRWLFTSTRDATYNCELRGRAATYLSPEQVSLLLEPDRTLLRARIARPGAVEWRPAADSCVGRLAILEILHCTEPRQRTTVLKRDIVMTGAKYANVVADLELTREYGLFPGGDSVVRTTLAARPVKPCGVPARKAVQTKRISSGLHHLKVHHTIGKVAVNYAPTCGKKLRVLVKVELLSGNPVTIHNQIYSNAIVLPS